MKDYIEEYNHEIDALIALLSSMKIDNYDQCRIEAIIRRISASNGLAKKALRVNRKLYDAYTLDLQLMLEQQKRNKTGDLS